MSLVFESVSKYFDSRIALRKISFEVKEGEIVSLLGPNGSGKTTAMRIAVGLLRPTEGDVYVCGHSISREPKEAKKYIGFVPDNPPMYDYLTGMEYLELILDLWGVSIWDKMKEIDRL